MSKTTKIFILTLLFSFFGTALFTAFAQASTDINFSALSVNVMEGEIFNVAISLNPNHVKNFTAKVELSFPPDLLEVVEFNKMDGWVALVQSGFDLIDNNAGLLIKTGGYVGGFSSHTTLGTVTFKAKESGSGVIRATGNSMILNANNQNVLSDFYPDIGITIRSVGTEAIESICGNNVLENGEGCDDGNKIDKDGCSETCIIEELKAKQELIKKLPAELFDINLEIDDFKVTDISKLASRVIFVSFGRVPTPVDLTFTIKNELGAVVHTEKDDIVVETEAVLTKEFENLILPLGKYTLTLETLYNVDVRDEFTQEFEIVEEKTLWILSVIALFTILSITKLILNRRKR